MLEISFQNFSFHPVFKLCHPGIKASDADLEQTGTVLLDATEPLVMAITGEYEQDPSQFQSDIHCVNSLINTIVKNTHSIYQYLEQNKSNIANQSELPQIHHEPLLQYLIKTLANYYLYFFLIQNNNVDKLFPNSIKFIWIDTFTEESHEQSAWAFEKANLLFNFSQLQYLIGFVKLNSKNSNGVAVGNSIGKELRQSLIAMKPYNHFYHAAHISNFIKVNFLHAPTDDMQGYAVDGFVSYFLGLAQLQMLQNCKKLALCVKLCKGAQSYFEKATEIPVLALSNDVKILNAFSNIYKAQLAVEQGKHGERIARLQNGLSILKSVSYTKEFLKLLQDEIKSAIKENDVVYHEAVPKIDELLEIDEVKAVSLEESKGVTTIDNIIESFGGKDVLQASLKSFLAQNNNSKSLFTTLVPLQVVESASLYSEKVSDVVREIQGQVDNSDALFEKWLSENHVLMRIKRFERSNISTGSASDHFDLKSLQSRLNDIGKSESEIKLNELTSTFTSTKQKTEQTIFRSSTLLQQESPNDPTLLAIFRNNIDSLKDSLAQASRNDQLIFTHISEFHNTPSLYLCLTNRISIDNYLNSLFPKEEPSLIQVGDVSPKLNVVKESLESWYQLKKSRESVLNDLKDKVNLF
eukprot:NODE_76_length_23837_cov_1.242396.p5 type:complete len:637 gc:universal NODE_76_length_23837_cov_1.242396:18998-20908(+)